MLGCAMIGSTSEGGLWTSIVTWQSCRNIKVMSTLRSKFGGSEPPFGLTAAVPDFFALQMLHTTFLTGEGAFPSVTRKAGFYPQQTGQYKKRTRDMDEDSIWVFS